MHRHTNTHSISRYTNATNWFPNKPLGKCPANIRQKTFTHRFDYPPHLKWNWNFNFIHSHFFRVCVFLKTTIQIQYPKLYLLVRAIQNDDRWTPVVTQNHIDRFVITHKPNNTCSISCFSSSSSYLVNSLRFLLFFSDLSTKINYLDDEN